MIISRLELRRIFKRLGANLTPSLLAFSMHFDSTENFRYESVDDLDVFLVNTWGTNRILRYYEWVILLYPDPRVISEAVFFLRELCIFARKYTEEDELLEILSLLQLPEHYPENFWNFVLSGFSLV